MLSLRKLCFSLQKFLVGFLIEACARTMRGPESVVGQSRSLANQHHRAGDVRERSFLAAGRSINPRRHALSWGAVDNNEGVGCIDPLVLVVTLSRREDINRSFFSFPFPCTCLSIRRGRGGEGVCITSTPLHESDVESDHGGGRLTWPACSPASSRRARGLAALFDQTRRSETRVRSKRCSLVVST